MSAEDGYVGGPLFGFPLHCSETDRMHAAQRRRRF
jgi:hypothetical protein